MAEIVRPAWADIDLSVIRENVRVLQRLFAPAELCAVVKADAYGHGCVPVAKAAIEGGVDRLAVALVEEARLLRESRIDAPILLLSEPVPEAMRDVVAHKITPTLYTLEGVRALASAVTEERFPVHVKIDTGMNRVGANADVATQIINEVVSNENLYWEGLWTHLAVADEPKNDFTHVQATRLNEYIDKISIDHELPPIIHACNTAGGIKFRAQRRALVRCGIGIYGVAPSKDVPLPKGVMPAMRVSTKVSFVKRLEAGDSISYGQRYTLDRPSNIATIPLGYADGVYRVLSSRGGEVLINGKRHVIAGNVTMDQTMIDCRDDPVSVGDEVVLIGHQGKEEVTANEWGNLADTIGYEVVCRIGPRIPRRYLNA